MKNQIPLKDGKNIAASARTAVEGKGEFERRPPSCRRCDNNLSLDSLARSMHAAVPEVAIELASPGKRGENSTQSYMISSLCSETRNPNKSQPCVPRQLNIRNDK